MDHQGRALYCVAMSTDRPPSASRGMGHSASMPAHIGRRSKAGRKSGGDNFGSRPTSTHGHGGHGRGGRGDPKGSSHRKPVKLTIRDIVVRAQDGRLLAGG